MSDKQIYCASDSQANPRNKHAGKRDLLLQIFLYVTKKKSFLNTFFDSSSFLTGLHTSSFIIKSIPVILGSYVNIIKGNYF